MKRPDPITPLIDHDNDTVTVAASNFDPDTINVGSGTDHLIGGERVGSASTFEDRSPLDWTWKLADIARGDASTADAAVLMVHAVASILILFTLALTWLAVIAGLSAKTVDGAGAFAYPIVFLPFISSAFVPTDTMPGPVRVFAENQPVTAIVNAIRDLFTQQPVGNDIWIALAWCVGILVVAYVFAMSTYRRKIS